MAEYNFEELIKDIASGDTAALEKLYTAYQHAVYALSLSILHSASLAEDVSQEVFLKIWANAQTYRLGANPKAWIMGITRNAAIDVMRKAKKEFSLESIEMDVEMASQFEEQVAVSITLEQLLQQLPEKDREIVVLKAIAGLSVFEVSKITQTPLNTVYWKYNKAIKKLRDLL